MDLGYAAEKFHATVNGIVTLPETLTPQAKLEMMAMGTHTLSAKDFPAELAVTFKNWRDALTRMEDPVEGSFRATIKSLSKSEIYDHLRTFYDLYWRVDEKWRNEQIQRETKNVLRDQHR